MSPKKPGCAAFVACSRLPGLFHLFGRQLHLIHQLHMRYRLDHILINMPINAAQVFAVGRGTKGNGIPCGATVVFQVWIADDFLKLIGRNIARSQMLDDFRPPYEELERPRRLYLNFSMIIITEIQHDAIKLGGRPMSRTCTVPMNGLAAGLVRPTFMVANVQV